MCRGAYVINVLGFITTLRTYGLGCCDGIILVVVLRVVDEGRIWIIFLDDCLAMIVDAGTVFNGGWTKTILFVDNFLSCPRMTRAGPPEKVVVTIIFLLLNEPGIGTIAAVGGMVTIFVGM